MLSMVLAHFHYLTYNFIVSILCFVSGSTTYEKNGVSDTHSYSYDFQFRESRFTIKDYFLHCLKLRVASCNLWKSSTPRTDLHSFLLSGARALFQQVSNFPCLPRIFLLVLGVDYLVLFLI